VQLQPLQRTLASSHASSYSCSSLNALGEPTVTMPRRSLEPQRPCPGEQHLPTLPPGGPHQNVGGDEQDRLGVWTTVTPVMTAGAPDSAALSSDGAATAKTGGAAWFVRHGESSSNDRGVFAGCVLCGARQRGVLPLSSAFALTV
jgi:hypothetical protein